MENNKHNAGPPGDESRGYHVPVLLQEAIDGLNIQPGGVYVDGTFGGGGHAREILRRLSSEGRLYLFDQDEDARRNLPDDTRIHFFPHNFRHMQRFLRLHKVGPVDGVLADLGVSSHQFDEPARGFSTRFDGDLDMRMDQRQSLTAFEVIHTYPEQRLHKIFEQYGEVTNAKTLAKKIVEVRQAMPLRTIASFRHAIAEVVKGNPHKYLAQVFQALRIEVNQELEALRDMLTQLPALLKPGGRVAIITFHSLEDRLVKQFFKNGSFDDGQENSDPFGQHTHAKLFRLINRKPIVPSAAEMTQNPRSRSARLRVAEKI